MFPPLLYTIYIFQSGFAFIVEIINFYTACRPMFLHIMSYFWWEMYYSPNYFIFLAKSNHRTSKRTTCIKAQKWPPTKPTYIVMNNSVVPLTETGMEIGDRHYIWGQNGVKCYDPIAILITGKLHCRGICLYPVIIFFFLKGFKSYIWHTKYFRNI